MTWKPRQRLNWAEVRKVRAIANQLTGSVHSRAEFITDMMLDNKVSVATVEDIIQNHTWVER